ncbi:MAG: ParB N-terminal domain-containing protein [Candidatus Paraimprobicoccus trichonymphae]|uniref:ParB N-terminal domain-containing protein n=1 Tax=Candidatus Paraimprobicoccus trichonymphae TaxID=3033793 RepID=A0AA48I061_9FIRM|nr:MAG: ParB N-terminal domain-containing protein [Candidatus Paraimprobicoccus trichonymphae]
MKIEKISINALKPYENNAKVHTEKQIGQIKKSIQEFGNNDPIAIDENNVIIEGHGRYQALKELNYEEIDVIKLIHLTNEQKKAYSLVHNKLTMNTGFDLDKINIELENIKNIDMSEFDFNINLDFSFGEDTEENTKNAELDTENFDDGSFKHECPRCKFKWNDE